jgi:Asp-tRNA(Asn)/Glu-tRNA(Gln) amidotransferase A subunit family amidase
MNIPISLPALADALRNNQLPLPQYLAELETRFAAQEPEIQAFVSEVGRFERLRREAEALLARYPDPATRPALFGVPVGVKDIFHVAGMPTRAGSQLPPEVLHGPEAESVTRLKKAGALIFGKTVTTEFAYFAAGPTRNPRSPAGATHTPGGSSSGSAAAVAAGLAPLALGTQTIGSIIRPAAFCGIVGFKPSYERISRNGVIPLAPSHDHVGVFAATAEGAAYAMSALVDDWRRDLSEDKRPTLGIPDGPYLALASEEALAHFRAICAALTDAGYTLKTIPALAAIEAVRERHNLLLGVEAAKTHASWLTQYRDRYHAKTLELIDRGQNPAPKALQSAILGREKLRRQLIQLMNTHAVDLWISPAAVGPAPEGLSSTGDPIMSLPWTHTGLPTVTIPSGLAANGLPLGLQLTGRWYADEEVLAWAEETNKVLVK